MFCKKKAVLKKYTVFTGKQLCWSLFLIKLIKLGLQACNFIEKRLQRRCFLVHCILQFYYQACNFIKKETLAQVFCEFCEISRNTFFTVHLRATASLWIYIEFISLKFSNLRTAASDYSFVLVIYLFSPASLQLWRKTMIFYGEENVHWN